MIHKACMPVYSVYMNSGKLLRTDGTGKSKVLQEVLADLKRVKKEFSDLKILHFSGIFLSGIGGYPAPLTDKIR